MSTKVIAKEHAGAIAKVSWWNTDVHVGAPEPFCPSAPATMLEDASGAEDMTAGNAQPAEASPVDPGINEEWAAKVESASRQEYARGFAEGEQAGFNKANQATKPVLEGLANSIAEFAFLRRRIRNEAEQDLVKLALSVAKKILHRELTIDPEALAGVVKAAIGKIEAKEVEKIRLNPRDAAILNDALAVAWLPPNAEIVKDASLAPGAILIETSRGQMDASISAQLNEIERGFVDRLEGR